MLFVKGIVLGFCIAAPVGPVGVLCIQRTLQSGFWAGVFSGLGTACADSLYAAVAVLGIALLADFMMAHEYAIRLVGGAFLLALSYRLFKAQSCGQPTLYSGRNMLGHFVSSFVLTITNPATIILFAAVFAGLGVVTGESRVDASIFIGGVFAGSMLWWLMLAGMVSRFSPNWLLAHTGHINRGIALLLGAFGIWAFTGAIIAL